MNTIEYKSSVHKALLSVIEAKISRLRGMVDALTEARNSDTKSSAGDKFETGREMMQREIDRVQGQLDHAIYDQQTILRIDAAVACEYAGMGALVECDNGVFYLSIAQGKMEVDGTTVYALSTGSPLGKKLVGGGPGAIIDLNGRQIKILSVI